jgi:hypothetical protein
MQYRLESWWGKAKLLWISYSSLQMSTFIPLAEIDSARTTLLYQGELHHHQCRLMELLTQQDSSWLQLDSDTKKNNHQECIQSPYMIVTSWTGNGPNGELEELNNTQSVQLVCFDHAEAKMLQRNTSPWQCTSFKSMAWLPRKENLHDTCSHWQTYS